MVSDYLLFYYVRWAYTAEKFRDVSEYSCFEEFIFFKVVTSGPEQIPMKATHPKVYEQNMLTMTEMMDEL